MSELRADDVRVAYPLFQTGNGGAIPTSALQLRFYRCDWKLYQDLVKKWHSRLPLILNAQTHIVCYIAEYEGLYYATAGWSIPCARMLPSDNWIELRRFAIAPEAPKNTASRMLSWMTKDIHKTMPHIKKLISYQDTEVHKGTIYKATGWSATIKSRGGEWSCLSRWRRPVQSSAEKIRWEYDL